METSSWLSHRKDLQRHIALSPGPVVLWSLSYYLTIEIWRCSEDAGSIRGLETPESNAKQEANFLLPAGMDCLLTREEPSDRKSVV